MTQDGRAFRKLILHEIARCHAEVGYPPTLKELAAVTGLCLSGANYHLVILIERGLVERVRKTPRALRLTPEGRRIVAVGAEVD